MALQATTRILNLRKLKVLHIEPTDTSKTSFTNQWQREVSF